MKFVITLFLLLSTAVNSFAQEVVIKDSSVKYTGDKIQVYYSNSGKINSIRMAAVKFHSGEKGIQFWINTRQSCLMRTDSINIYLSGEKSPVAIHVLRDTIIATPQLNLHSSALYMSNNKSLFDDQLISSLSFAVDGELLSFRIKQKAAKAFKEQN